MSGADPMNFSAALKSLRKTGQLVRGLAAEIPKLAVDMVFRGTYQPAPLRGFE